MSIKKAWKMELELIKSALPVILSDEEQGWNIADSIEQMDDAFLKMKWKSNVPGSGAPEQVIVGAVQAVENMGYNVKEAEALLPKGFACLEQNDIIGLNRITSRIWNALDRALPIPEHTAWSFRHYERFEAYCEDVTFPNPIAFDKESPDYEAANYAGWLAQIIGGAAGTAVEGYLPQAIYDAFGTIRTYVRKPNTYNDDITYEVAFLKALERCGKHLTSADIADEWVALIPFGWSAEEWALKNIKMGIYPPISGKLHNPYREWIGAQMRGAVCGMIAPGDYRKAAEYAFMDGVVSHYNNGVIGEVFNAMLVAGAYVNPDVRDLLKTVVELIPAKSEYYGVVSHALTTCQKHSHWEAAWDECQKRYEHYNWIHAYPNAAAEVVALWFGSGSFSDTMSISCNQGYDVDCNAAQIGTVLGIQRGLKGLESHWTKPIGDRLDTYIRGHKQMSIRELAAFTTKLSRDL